MREFFEWDVFIDQKFQEIPDNNPIGFAFLFNFFIGFS